MFRGIRTTRVTRITAMMCGRRRRRTIPVLGVIATVIVTATTIMDRTAIMGMIMVVRALGQRAVVVRAWRLLLGRWVGRPASLGVPLRGIRLNVLREAGDRRCRMSL